MKKIKLYLVMSVLAIVLCACGKEDETQRSESDVESKTQKKQEEVMEHEEEDVEKLKEADNFSKETSEESSEVVEEVREESFECLPEILNASLEDCLLQVDNTILRNDRTMALNEMISAMNNSGVEYTFKVDEKDFNPQMLVAPYSSLTIQVLKNEKHYFYISAVNYSEDTVSGDSENIIVTSIYFGSAEWGRNTYYAKGIRADGYGHTYTSVKELLKDYADCMSESSKTVYDSEGNEYPGIEIQINTKGENRVHTILHFKSEDGACVLMSSYKDY